MKKKNRINSYYFSIIIMILTCTSACQTNNASQTRILSEELNNLAADYFAKRFDDEKYIELAIEKASKAIEYNSLNISAYSNLAIYYDWTSDSEKAIEILNLAITRIKSPEIASIYIQRGLHFITMGILDEETKLSFEMARKYYNKQLLNRDSINVEFVLSEIAFTYLITHSEDRAIIEIDRVLVKFPNSNIVIGYKNEIMTFFKDMDISN